MEELIIRENETRQKLVTVINESGLPAFALEDILKDVLIQIGKEKERQLQEAYAVLSQRKEKNKKKEVKEDAKN